MTLEAWDRLPESERAWWLERDRRRRNVHSCGHERDVCSDAERVWHPQLTVCYADMERAAAQAKWERLRGKRVWHDGTFTRWAEEPSDRFPYHMSYGTTVWVALEDHGFGGDFLTPRRPVTNQGEAQHSEADDGHNS